MAAFCDRCGVEWTGTQQILCFLQSVILGAGLGFLFEMFSALVRLSRSSVGRFILDAVYGVLAASITFFSALIITDGRLHPLLFTGSLCGFICEHYAVGRSISRGMTWLLRRIGKGIRIALDFADGFLFGCGSRLCATGKCWLHWIKQRFLSQK